MYNVKQAAEILGLSIRSIQLKCKKHKVSKIGNEFQITDEILEMWKKGANEKRNVVQVIAKSSRRNVTSLSTFVIVFLIVLSLGLGVLFYIKLDTQIVEANNTIKIKDKEHRNEVKDLTKKINDVREENHLLELENQSLKIKDSLRVFKRW